MKVEAVEQEEWELQELVEAEAEEKRREEG